jgi:hypothetical protein
MERRILTNAPLPVILFGAMPRMNSGGPAERGREDEQVSSQHKEAESDLPSVLHCRLQLHDTGWVVEAAILGLLAGGSPWEVRTSTLAVTAGN